MKMPQMGESIQEGTIIKWLKQVGEEVRQDEIILEISTDKVDSAVPAPASGVLLEILAREGDVVAVGNAVAVIDAEAKLSAKETVERPQSPRESTSSQGEKTYSPLAKKIAAEHGLGQTELERISGSGALGRVTKEDLLGYLSSESASESKDRPVPISRPQFGADGIAVEPLGHMRKKIAEHMVRSKAVSPHVYSVTEVDITAVSRWRQTKQQAFLEREGFKLSFTPFFLEAVTKALTEYPRMNASLEGENLLIKQHVNLGCAVALGKDGQDGLIVPVIRQADELSFVGLARALQELALKAREKRLSPEDVQDGTFTLTNPGIFGNIFGCPIINQPQLGILATGAIKKRPVVIGDAIGIREMMYLTLSYDHRVIDGALSGLFLSFIRDYLESWDDTRAV
jgi:2-oxoglutarate dehydrogenase E2 component (dihydrolipoamide succinyltransferase)